MEQKEDSNIDNTASYRKFGLPNWMVNNIERLNFVTDFEQYACSPPETEGFLTDHVESCDFYDDPPPRVIVNEPVKEKPQFTENKGVTESKSAPNLLANATEKLAKLSVLDNLKHEDLYSSPDTTPCATPEPSPAPRRRMSGQQDTVQTNPGGWFYLGQFKKPDQNSAKGLNTNNNKENRKKSVDRSHEAALKLKDQSANEKKDGIRLVISNFDINAISPSSW